MFDIEIAGQMAGWFLHKEGGTMSHLKLMKLLYIAERTSLQENSYPILGDELFSMDNGPMLSFTYDYMKKRETKKNGWSKWVSQIWGGTVSLVKPYNPGDLDLLSKATLEVLEEVWNRYGQMTQKEIVEHTHTFPEWKNPHGSSIKIKYKDLLDALGYGEKSKEIAEELEAQQQASKALLA